MQHLAPLLRWLVAIAVFSCTASSTFAQIAPIIHGPIPVRTLVCFHCFPPSTDDEVSSDWFSPVVFTGESPMVAWERSGTDPDEDDSYVIAVSDLSAHATNGCHLPIHSKILRINTCGNRLVFPAGFPSGIPAQQSAAVRMCFVSTDAPGDRFPDCDEGASGTAALFLGMDYVEESFHFYVRAIVDGKPTWVRAKADGAAWHENLWCDVCVVLDNVVGQPVRASYYVDGLLLKDSGGNGSFQISMEPGPYVMGEISFSGVGHVDSLRGSWLPFAGSIPDATAFTARLTEAMSASALSPLTLTNDVFSLRFDAPYSGTYLLQTSPTPAGPFVDTDITADALLGSPVALDIPTVSTAAFHRVKLRIP